MRRRARAVLLALASGGVCLGCMATTVRSGLPRGGIARGYEERWHHGFLLGTVEASGPYDLHEICPEGWAELRTEASFATAAFSWAFGIYTPALVTIRCAAAPGDARSPSGEGPLP